MRLGYRAKSRGWDSGSAVGCLARIEGLKTTKRVETFRIPCLDAGSTPATSTEKDEPFAGSSFFVKVLNDLKDFKVAQSFFSFGFSRQVSQPPAQPSHGL